MCAVPTFAIRVSVLFLMCLMARPVAAEAHGLEARTKELDAAYEKMIWRAIDDPKSKVNWGEADAIIEQPADKIIEVLRAYGGYRYFLPFFTGSAVEKELGSTAVVRLKAKILNGTVTLKARVMATEEEKKGKTHHFSLRLIKGNVKRLDANWSVTPINEKRSLVTFSLIVDPDLWMVPNSKLSNYNLVNVRRTIRSLRKHIAKKK